MKILFVGHLSEGQTSLDRLRSLRRLGQEVVPFDLTRFESGHRLLRSAQARWQPRVLLKDLNDQLVALKSDLRDLDCVWVDKGVWIFPETLEALRDATGCRLVHYTPDSQIISNRSRFFLESIPIYDLFITTKTFELDDYRRLSARRVKLVLQGYCPVRFSSPQPQPEFAHDVGFISAFKPNYGRIIRELSESISDIGVWGPRWRRASLMRRVPKRVVKGDAIWGVTYVNALASFRIGLGLLAKYIPEQHTTRTFEIPAAGSFLLAERTAEHQALFQEGLEAEYFETSEELVSKVKYYLEHEGARARIAERGRERCLRSGYDNDSILSNILREIA
jgi:spore maturation protein CgeB